MKIHVNSFAIISILFSLFIGCVSFNTPFIDIDETIQLQEGLTIKETKEKLGAPLIVKSGINKSNEIIWIYEVRTIEVESKPDIIPVIQVGGPNKTHAITQHDKPIHRLSITFVDSKVASWGTIEKEPVDDDADKDEVEAEDDTKTSVEKDEESGSVKRSKKKQVFNHSLQGNLANLSVGLRYEKRIKKNLWIGGQCGMHEQDQGLWLGLYAVKPLINKGFFQFHQLVGLSNWGTWAWFLNEELWDKEYRSSWGFMIEERIRFFTPINGLSIDIHAGLVTGDFGDSYFGGGLAYSF